MRLKKHLFLLSFISISLSFAQKNNEIHAINITKRKVFDNPVTKNCHSATLVEIQPNKIVSAWFGGTYEGAKNVGIYMSYLNDNNWSRPTNIITPLIKDNDTLPCWNPVLFKSKSKKLYLFYKVGKNPREWFGAMITSLDDGKTWTSPTYLPDGFLGPIKNKPIEISPGEILCASSTESIKTNKWRVHLEKFSEATGNWTKILIANPKNFDIIQPTFLEHSKDSLQVLCRSKHNKLITSWSYDMGQNWTAMDSINVVNSNSGIDAVSLENKGFLIVNNPLKMGAEWYNGRNVLDVEYSKDGLSWTKLFDLENKEKGEFSYPAIIQTGNKEIHVLYTFNREFIKHISFELSRTN